MRRRRRILKRSVVSHDTKLRLAVKMRAAPTTQEEALLCALKRLGVKTAPQAVMLGYIADILVPDVGLVVEVDGGGHRMGDRAAYDGLRDGHMRQAGYRVLRFTNEIDAGAREAAEVVRAFVEFYVRVDRLLTRDTTSHMAALREETAYLGELHARRLLGSHAR
jgi:very-short-patch-repair endonuclease